MVRFHSDGLLDGGNPAGQAYLLSGGSDRQVRQSSIWSAQQDTAYSQKREESKQSMHVTSEVRERARVCACMSERTSERARARSVPPPASLTSPYFRSLCCFRSLPSFRSLVCFQPSRHRRSCHHACYRHCYRMTVRHLPLPEQVERRLPPLTGLATSMAREGEWANVLTCHAKCRHAYTWETTRRALAKHSLSLKAPSAVTAVAISPCGNFGFLGGESGAIEKFNLQSGGRRATAAEACGHVGAVRGLEADALSRAVFSGGADGSLREWDPTKLAHTRTTLVGAPVSFLRHHRDSTLLAAACDDIAIRIYDGARPRPSLTAAEPLTHPLTHPLARPSPPSLARAMMRRMAHPQPRAFVISCRVRPLLCRQSW